MNLQPSALPPAHTGPDGAPVGFDLNPPVTQFELAPRAPFDFRHTLAQLAAEPAPGGAMLVAGSVLKAISLGAVTAACEVSEPTPGSGRILVRVHAGTGEDPRLVARARSVVAAWLGTDHDIAGFLEVAASDPALTPILELYSGMHPIGTASLVESAVWAVLAQNCPVPVARYLRARLVTTLGQPVWLPGPPPAGEPVNLVAFPTLTVLDSVGAVGLAGLLHNRRRADLLARLCRRLAEVGSAWLREAPYAEARAALTDLPGIGAWSAEVILLRGAGRLEALGVSRVRLRPVIERVYGPGADPRLLANRYGPWKGLWAAYLNAANRRRHVAASEAVNPRRR